MLHSKLEKTSSINRKAYKFTRTLTILVEVKAAGFKGFNSQKVKGLANLAMQTTIDELPAGWMS
eukprot:scaffold626175_cov15-Prasinocladus_malaysianus.AAC.1